MAETPTGRERLKPLAAAKIPFTDHAALMRLSTSGLGAETIKQYSVRYRTALAVILDLDPSLADLAPAARIDENLIAAIAEAYSQRMSLSSADKALRALRTVYCRVLPECDGTVFEPALDRLRIALAEDDGEPDDLDRPRRRSYALPVDAWPADDRAAYDALIARGEPLAEVRGGDWSRFLGVAAKDAPQALSLPLHGRLTREAVAAYASHTARGSVQVDKTARLRTLKLTAQHLCPSIATSAIDDVIRDLRRPDRLTGGLAAFGLPVLEAESDMLLTGIETATLRALTQGGITGHDDLAETTAIHCEYSYRSMLAHAARAGIAVSPDLAARDWQATLAALLAARPRWQAATRQARLIEIRAVLRRLPVAIDLAFLDDEIAAAEADAKAQRKPFDVPDIDAARLLAAAVNLCRDAMRRFQDLSSVQTPYADPDGALERFRGALVLALMTLVPLRVGNFSELIIGASFREREAGRYDIEIRASAAKGRRRLVEEVPEILVPLVGFYLDVARPRLGGEGSTALWPNPDDGRPLSASWFQRMVPELIHELTGLRLAGRRATPHTTRAIAATTARAVSPNPNVGQSILGHAHPATTRRFYGKMSDSQGRAVIATISRQALGPVLAANGLDIGA